MFTCYRVPPGPWLDLQTDFRGNVIFGHSGNKNLSRKLGEHPRTACRKTMAVVGGFTQIEELDGLEKTGRNLTYLSYVKLFATVPDLQHHYDTGCLDEES